MGTVELWSSAAHHSGVVCCAAGVRCGAVTRAVVCSHGVRQEVCDVDM